MIDVVFTDEERSIIMHSLAFKAESLSDVLAGLLSTFNEDEVAYAEKRISEYKDTLNKVSRFLITDLDYDARTEELHFNGADCRGAVVSLSDVPTIDKSEAFIRSAMNKLKS